MARYWGTIFIAAVVLGVVSLFAFVVLEPFEEPILSKTFFWPILSVCSIWVLLSIWGLIGGFISWGKEKTEVLATQDVVISKKSWHYRLSTWANGGWEPTNVKSECEYWARLFHGLSTVPLLLGIAAVILIVIGILGWLVSYRPRFFSKADKSFIADFEDGHQLLGPAVVITLVIGLTALFVPYSSLESFAGGVPWKYVGIAAAVLLASVVVTIFVRKILWPSLKRGASPLFAFASTRIIGRVCRTISYSG